MNVEAILVGIAGICAGWLTISLRRRGDVVGAIEHSLLAGGFIALAYTLFAESADRVAPYLFFAAMVGRLVDDWYMARRR